MTKRIELWKAKDGRWYWHIKAANGTLGDHGQGHSRKWNAKRAALASHPGLPVVVIYPLG